MKTDKHERIRIRIKKHHDLAFEHCLKDAKKIAKRKDEIHTIAKRLLDQRAVPIVVSNGKLFVGIGK